MDDEDLELTLVEDPFAANVGPRVPQPALTEHHEVTFDIYSRLFDEFFDSHEFRYWSSGLKNWHLHAYGGPGCGKTTLAAVLAHRLRNVPEQDRVPVVSVYVEMEVATNEAEVLEDFLHSIYSQLALGMAEAADDSVTAYASYQQACTDGKRVAYRIKMLRRAVASQLPMLTRAFLILDGYDRLNEALKLLFDQVFELLSPKIDIFITRRVPQFKRGLDVVCDVCWRASLKLYWECQKCKGPEQSFALCYDCRIDEKEICRDCGNDISFTEPYDHVEFNLRVPDESMSDYVEWSFEREYSDAKLSDENRQLLQPVAKKAHGNITMAKLRLENLFSRTGSMSTSMDKVSDRLPRNIAAIFDAGIKRINQLPEGLRFLTLAAITLAANELNGISLKDMGVSLRSALLDAAALANQMPRSAEDLIRSANGLLELASNSPLSEVSCYHEDFTLYVQEDYNDSLHSAKTRLQNLSSPKAENSAVLGETRSLVESPPPLGSSFDTASDSMTEQTSRSRSDRTIESVGLGIVNDKEISSWTGLPDRINMSPPRMDSEQQVMTLSQNSIEKPDMQDPRITEPQSTRICHFCLQHVLSGQSSGPHHNTLGKIKEAVADKCIFCQAIYKGVGNMIEDVMPLYDWNVRPAGRSSEGLSTIAIVFRPHTHSGASKIPKGIRTFYMYPEKDLGDILSVSSATTSTDPYHSNGSQISNWLQTCNFTHAGCRKPVPGDFVPTRLLELQNNNHGFVKLVLRGEDYDQGPYCTLSHTWGPPPTTFLNTTNENLETHRKQGIEISSLPNNFRHAIDVARFIGMRYIWIDSLCIIQKDGGADFAFEGQLMHKVYRYSYCNIAAADSADSSGGLFRARDPLDIVPPRFQSNSSSIFGKQTWRVISEDLWDTELLGTSIYKRGWVFQERMLSPRLLHFARDQIFWDCGTISACETVPSNIPYPVDRIATTDRHWRGRLQHRLRDEQAPVVGANDDSIESFWQTAVFNYTSCNLTMQKDKTVAIWSIAKLVRDMTGEKYACGFWSRKLEEQLAWRVADVGQSTRLAELQWWNPSWSWSSVKATILAQDRVVPWRYHTVKDHQGQTIAFPPPSSTSNGEAPAVFVDSSSSVSADDIEPSYAEPPSIAMKAQIHSGLVRGIATGSFRLAPVITDARNDDWEIHFEAFPDEVPNVNSVGECCYSFMILAATQNLKRPLPSTNSSSPSTHQIDGVSSKSTYSGVGLLLEPPNDAIPRYQLQIPYLERKLSQLSPTDDWGKRTVQNDLKHVKSLIKRLEQQTAKSEAGEKHYRRVGAVHFQEVNEEVWASLMGGDEVNFWLD